MFQNNKHNSSIQTHEKHEQTPILQVLHRAINRTFLDTTMEAQLGIHEITSFSLRNFSPGMVDSSPLKQKNSDPSGPSALGMDAYTGKLPTGLGPSLWP